MNEKEQLFLEGKKRCTKCNEVKTLKSFSPQKAGYKGYKSQCRLCDKEYDKLFQQKTNYRANRDKSDKSIQYRKEYIKKNIDWWRKYEREYRNNRRQEDMFFRIKSNLSSRLSELINKKILSKNTIELLGCDKSTFMRHLESKFVDGMNWDNYGLKGWHVDHIIALSKFNLLDEEEVKKACHYLNLQPLWWYDNLEKSNK